MKALFLILSISIVTSTAFSQAALKQGTTSLGGSISFLGSKQENGSYTRTESQFNFTPQFTKFVKDNVELGFLAVYQQHKVEETMSYFGGNYNNTFENKTLGMGTLLNIYFPLKETMAGFIGAGASLTTNPDYTQFKLFTFFAQAGLNIYLTDYAAVNIKGQYSVLRPSEGDSKGSTFLIGAGMTYYLLD